MSQSTSLNDRISTAHKASEEIAPWIQRDVQQALDLLRRQEEISLPAAHRHAAVIERLDKQEKCAALFAAAVTGLSPETTVPRTDRFRHTVQAV